jgi:hypothetical protein
LRTTSGSRADGLPALACVETHLQLHAVSLLDIYFQDHLALGLAGVRLAKRCERENRGNELGAYLARLVPELEEDWDTLARVARALGGGRSVVKEALATVGEMVGRLKLNGRLLSYSELSRVWELEALMAGTQSRRSAWRILGKLLSKDPRLAGFELERFEERAAAQGEELERWHFKAARQAFAPAPARGVRVEAPAEARPH